MAFLGHAECDDKAALPDYYNYPVNIQKSRQYKRCARAIFDTSITTHAIYSKNILRPATHLPTTTEVVNLSMLRLIFSVSIYKPTKTIKSKYINYINAIVHADILSIATK